MSEWIIQEINKEKKVAFDKKAIPKFYLFDSDDLCEADN